VTSPGPWGVTAKPLDAVTTHVSDRSLDEFATASPATDEESESDGDQPTDEADDSSVAPDSDADADPTEAATPTMRWSSTPVACDACGAAVSRRWRASGSSADGFVCADCKEW